MSDITVPSNSTVPLTDIVRARVAADRVTMPVQGAGTVMLKNITAVPAFGDDAGYSVTRLQALDRLIDRIRFAHGQEPEFSDLSAVEKEDFIMEKAVEKIVEDAQRTVPQLGLYQGLVLDMTI